MRITLGDCAVFDNPRIMHGRKGYSLADGGFRQVQGGYVDWDEANSRVNALRAKFRDNLKTRFFFSRCSAIFHTDLAE
jgi:hypothetical protein